MGDMPRYMVTTTVVVDITASDFNEAAGKATDAIVHGTENVPPAGSAEIVTVTAKSVVDVDG